MKLSEAEIEECPACCGTGVMEGECVCGDDTCCCDDPEPPECLLCDGTGIKALEG